MNINISYRCWPIVWVRKGQAEFLWLLPTYKILEWNFWLPQQPAMKIIRVELCTMLVAASSMLFSLRCGKLEPVPTSAAQYSILATIHTFLLIHSSVCWPWIDDEDYGYAGCENVYPTRIGAATQVHISFLFYRYTSVIRTDWECRQFDTECHQASKTPFRNCFLCLFLLSPAFEVDGTIRQCRSLVDCTKSDTILVHTNNHYKYH